MAAQIAKTRPENKGRPVFLRFIAEPRNYTNLDRLTDMFLKNEGKPLTMLEQAKGIKRFVDEFGIKPKEIAKKLHKSPTFVTNCLLLVEAPDYVQRQISQNVVAPTLVIDLLKSLPMDEATQVLKDTIENLSSKPRQLTIDQAQGSTENFATGEGNPDQPNRITPDKGDDEDDRILLLEDENTEDNIRDNGSQIRPVTVHVTKKDIEKQLEKYNSWGAVKTMLKKYPNTTFNMRREREEELTFLQKIVDGDISAHEIWNRFFSISSEEELKDQLKG
jgi:ParB-like chromosome segregation protein Spo0J